MRSLSSVARLRSLGMWSGELRCCKVEEFSLLSILPAGGVVSRIFCAVGGVILGDGLGVGACALPAVVDKTLRARWIAVAELRDDARDRSRFCGRTGGLFL